MACIRILGHSRILRSALLVLLLSTTAASVEFKRNSESAQAAGFVNWEGPRVFFPDSGQALGGVFLQKWALDFRDLELGAPLTPAIHLDGKVSQWTEFGRLEYHGSDISQATLDEVVRAPIGREYAERMGYARWVRAFKPIPAGLTQARYFYETRHSLANDFLHVYEQPGVEERLGAPISQEFTIGAINYQFFEYGAMSWDAANGTQIVPLGRLDASHGGYGNLTDDHLPGDIRYSSANMLLLSDAFPGERWIEVDLSNYEMIAWVGDVELLRTDVITGPQQAPTPTGTFSIYLKHQIQNLTGIGWNGQPYYAPGTPWVMYFYLDFGIHGSTWRSSYGYGSGEGCVIPPNDVAEQLWKWADYGTKVWVHY
ncbi:hypothetical protein BH23CHL2_BH23CHL2_00170 [soil metagenome]